MFEKGLIYTGHFASVTNESRCAPNAYCMDFCAPPRVRGRRSSLNYAVRCAIKCAARSTVLTLLYFILCFAPDHRAAAFWTGGGGNRQTAAFEALQDRSNRLTIEEVSALPDSQWESPLELRRNMGSALWMRIRLPRDATGPVLLEYFHHGADEVTCFLPGVAPATEWQMFAAGEKIPLRNRSVRCIEPVFLIPAAAGTPYVYLRVRDRFTSFPTLYVWSSPEAFFEARLGYELLMGGFIGLFLTLALTVTFLWALSRDAATGNAIGMILSLLLFVLIVGGYDLALLPGLSGRPYLLQEQIPFILAVFFLLRFAHPLLEVRKRIPGISLVWRYVTWGWLALAAFLILPVTTMGNVVLLYRVATILVVVAIGVMTVLCLRRGSPSAPHFAAGFAAFAVAVLFLQFSPLGVVAIASPAAYLMALGAFAVSMLAFTAMLIWRTFNDRNAHLKDIDQTVEASAVYMEQLESTVRRRNRQIGAVNRTKERVLTVLTNDIQGLLASSMRASRTIADKASVAGTEISYLGSELFSVNRRLQEVVQQLSDWARSRIGISGRAEGNCDLTEVATLALRIVATELHDKQLSAKTDLPAAAPAMADAGAMGIVMRNFLANVIKFTPEASPFQIRVHSGDRGWTVTVTNPIRLADETPANDSPSAGQAGIGLLLSREILSEMGSELRVVSTASEFTASFTVPIYTSSRESDRGSDSTGPTIPGVQTGRSASIQPRQRMPEWQRSLPQPRSRPPSSRE